MHTKARSHTKRLACHASSLSRPRPAADARSSANDHVCWGEGGGASSGGGRSSEGCERTRIKPWALIWWQELLRPTLLSREWQQHPLAVRSHLDRLMAAAGKLERSGLLSRLLLSTLKCMHQSCCLAMVAHADWGLGAALVGSMHVVWRGAQVAQSAACMHSVTRRRTAYQHRPGGVSHSMLAH